MAESSVELSAANATPKQQCWECLRRQISCDGAALACRTCISSSVVCPGYENKRPLRWLAPGTVTLRTKKKKARVLEPNHTEAKTGKKMRAVVRPSTLVVRTDADDIIEAAVYYNTHIYPHYAAVKKLAPNAFVNNISMETVHIIPSSVLNTLVFMALGHRVSQSPEGTEQSSLAVLKTRMYDHRGKAIQAIHHVLQNDSLRETDYALLLVLMLLFGELRQSACPTWTHHFEGASRMIGLRGGLMAFVDHQYLRSHINYFLILGVMANTTNNPSSQLTLTSNASLVDIISNYYGDGLFPVLLCPPALFLEIIRINDLRARASRSENPTLPGLELSANEILQRVLEFVPKDWVSAQISSYGDNGAELWLLLGGIYQSAIALYAIASLQSLSVLVPSPRHEATLSHHRENLVTCLHKALEAPEIRMWMMWPLVVAGLEARQSEDVRRFVRTELGKMSRALGTPLPILARSALDNFWAKGGTGWDGCFESGFAFVT